MTRLVSPYWEGDFPDIPDPVDIIFLVLYLHGDNNYLDEVLVLYCMVQYDTMCGFYLTASECCCDREQLLGTHLCAGSREMESRREKVVALLERRMP